MTLGRALIAVTLAAVAAGWSQGAQGSQGDVLLVLGGRAAESPALVARARAAAERPHTELRITRTPAEELGVTHLFAARRYATVVAVDLDARVSVTPVAERYPTTRFVTVGAEPGAIQRALATVTR